MQRKFNTTLESFEDAARRKLETLQDGVKLTKRAARTVDRYSHRKPWIVVGIFSFAAYVMGFLFGLKRNGGDK